MKYHWRINRYGQREAVATVSVWKKGQTIVHAPNLRELTRVYWQEHDRLSGTSKSSLTIKTIGDVLDVYKQEHPTNSWHSSYFVTLKSWIGTESVKENEAILCDKFENKLTEFRATKICTGEDGKGEFSRLPSPAYANKLINLLKTADSFCFQRKYVMKRLFKKLSATKEPPRDRCPTPDEVFSTVDALIGWAKTLVMAALATGSRWGELAKLKSCPSDVRVMRIDCKPVLVEVCLRNRKNRTKEISERWAELPQDLYHVVDDVPLGGPLFPRIKNGEVAHIDRNAFNQAMHRAFEKAEVAPFKMGDVRSRAITDFLMAGYPVALALQKFGHFDIRMAEQRYLREKGAYHNFVNRHCSTGSSTGQMVSQGSK